MKEREQTIWKLSRAFRKLVATDLHETALIEYRIRLYTPFQYDAIQAVRAVEQCMISGLQSMHDKWSSE